MSNSLNILLKGVRHYCCHTIIINKGVATLNNWIFHCCLLLGWAIIFMLYFLFNYLFIYLLFLTTMIKMKA